jgi:hypothetical protein
LIIELFYKGSNIHEIGEERSKNQSWAWGISDRILRM